MKGKVLKPQRVVWSSETREVTVDYEGKTLIVRQHEDDNHGENWVSVDGGEFEEVYYLEDEKLKKFALTIAYNIRSGEFDEEGTEFDTSDFDEE
jgi:hypothetical protein